MLYTEQDWSSEGFRTRGDLLGGKSSSKGTSVIFTDRGCLLDRGRGDQTKPRHKEARSKKNSEATVTY